MSQESVLIMIACTAKMISTTASSRADMPLFHAKVKSQLIFFFNLFFKNFVGSD